MDDHLKKEIISDLQKAGRVSEMKPVRVLLSRGWHCQSGVYYLDRDEEKMRELDFLAWRCLSVEKVDSCFYLLGQVKKSDKPWVVFRSGLRSTQDWLLTYSQNLPAPPARRSLFEKLNSQMLISRCGWQGYGIHESFKNPGSQSQWYSAFVTSCKVALDTLEEWESTFEKANGTEDTVLTFIKPMVIIDSTLVSAEVSSQGHIEVDEIDAAPVKFKYGSKQYRFRDYTVDVLKPEFLDEYTSRVEKAHQDVFDALLEAMG